MGNAFRLPCTDKNKIIQQVKDTSATAQISTASRTDSNASSPVSQASEDLGRTLHTQTATNQASRPRKPKKTVSINLEKNQSVEIPRVSKTDLLMLRLELKKIEIDQSLIHRLERIKGWGNPELAVKVRNSSISTANLLKERINAATNELESISAFKLVRKNHSLMSELNKIDEHAKIYIANSAL